MMVSQRRLMGGAAMLAAALPVAAFAQATTADELMAMSNSSLNGEMQRRYSDALALTQDASVVSADTTQYMWASQAKVQCGIAIGYLKSGHKDPVSVGKCVDAHQRMQAAPPAPPPPPPAPPEICSSSVAGLVFFDWDSAIPSPDADQTLSVVVSNMAQCNWQGLAVTGHTDRSGSDAYNEGLSVARANAVADMLEGRGIARGQLDVSGRGETEPRVPTLDGERNPANRRVEITVR